MASTKADNNRVAWTYTDDKNRDWRVSAKAVYVLDVTDGAKYGGSAAASSVQRIPKELKMRRVKCTSNGKPDKWMVAYEPAATIYTTPGTTLTLDTNGIDAIFDASDTTRGEKRRDTVTQSA